MSDPAPLPLAGVFLARAAGAAVLLLAAVPAGAQEPGPVVEAVRFEGVRALDEELLRDAIVTRPGECKSPLFFLFCRLGFGWARDERRLDAAELAQDVERLETLYEIWGYPEATVVSRVERRDDAARVVFRVEEGEPIRVASLEIRGLDALDPPVRVPRPLPLRVGEPYALPRLDSLRRRIAAEFAERGHPYARVEIGGDVDEVARSARIVLVAEPGPAAVFGPAVIEAARPIDEEVVRERLAFRPGEPFRPSALEETERALFALPVVERASIEPQGVERGDTVISPLIRVAPRKIHAIQGEGTISSTDCLELAVFYVNRYFLGGPRLFSTGVGFSNLLARQVGGGFPCTSAGEGEFADPNYFVRAELRQPWPGEPRTAVLLGAFFRRESAPQVYVQRGYGGQLGVARELRRDLVVTGRYSPERNQLRAAEIYFCGNFGVCTPEGLEELSDFDWLSPVELLVAWTPSGTPASVRRPAPGERWRRWIRAGAETAAAFTGSEFDYARGLGEGALTRLLGGRAELAAHARIGVLTGTGDVVPPQVRLYSGGVNTVRGVAQNLLGPKVLVTAPERVDELGCALATRGCPAGTRVDPELVSVRPTGGDALLEANLEGRLWLTDSLQFAAFVDFGAIRRALFGRDNELFPAGSGEALITPGIGVRILTGLGPIRVDVGYDPSGERRYPLLTRDPDTDRLVFLGGVTYDPFGFGDPGPFGEFWRRLQLHVAIGQPF